MGDTDGQHLPPHEAVGSSRPTSESTGPALRLPWVMRRDLEVYPADHGTSGWTIKDPVKLSYFRIESEELAVLQLLDGQRSWQDIALILKDRFPDTMFSERSVKSFLTVAVRTGLLVPAGVGYGEQLAANARQARGSRVSRKMFSLISHRFRGIDPTALLQVLDRWLGWVFHRRVLQSATLFVVAAALLVLARSSQLLTELPSISQLVTSRNVILLSLAIVVVKVLHEIGHGLTCCHYGGECHELGCIMIGFLPLLYCDVSDSWLQQNRQHRMQVAAAGIAVELFLAAVFGLLWIASVPGLLHAFFLNVMLVCSLNTVLVNGNPLLRYDGYYVLSDLLRIPNLGPESRAAAVSVFDRVVLGLQNSGHSAAAGFQRIWMPVFGAASMVYRLVVTMTILLVIHATLKTWRLESVTVVLAFSVFLGMALTAILLFRQRLRAVSAEGRVSVRAAVGFGIFLTVLALAVSLPLPYSIDVPCTLTPGIGSPVFVSAAGYVEPQVAIGDTVTAGQVLAELTNPELLLELEDVTGEVRLRQARVQYLASTRSGGTAASSASALPAAQQAVQSAQARLQTLRQKATRLTLTSPAAGIVYPPRQRPKRTASAVQQTFWSGTPLDKTNHAAWLSEQTLVCWVSDPDQLRLIAYVPQEQIEFVWPNAAVEVRFRSLPGDPVPGNVTIVNSSPEVSAPPELAVSGMLATVDREGSLSATVYATQVQLTTDPTIHRPPLYSTGFARITCEDRSLASRCWRLLSHTFAFEL